MRELIYPESQAVSGGITKSSGHHYSGGGGGGGGGAGGGGSGGGYQFGISLPGSGGSGGGAGTPAFEGSFGTGNMTSGIMGALGQMGFGSALACGAGISVLVGTDGAVALIGGGLEASYTCAQFSGTPLAGILADYVTSPMLGEQALEEYLMTHP